MSTFHPIIALGPLGPLDFFVIFALFGMIAGFIAVLPFWHICEKAGIAPWLSLMILLPLGFYVVPFIIALKEWPSLHQNKPTDLPQLKD